MEWGENEAIDRSDNQDLASERGHLGGSGEGTALGWLVEADRVLIYTGVVTAASTCIRVGIRLRVNQSGQLELLAGSSRYLGAGGTDNYLFTFVPRRMTGGDDVVCVSPPG